MEDLKLPAFDYYLDESDPDIVILRRQDDSFVAGFSASGATREGIIEAAKEDYWELLRAYLDSIRKPPFLEQQRNAGLLVIWDGLRYTAEGRSRTSWPAKLAGDSNWSSFLATLRISIPTRECGSTSSAWS